MKKKINDAGFLRDMNHDARVMATDILLENNKQNIDTANNIDARQLFITVLDKIMQIKDEQDKHFFFCLLEEQLTDMKNLGPCPQGRTTRLLQLLQSL